MFIPLHIYELLDLHLKSSKISQKNNCKSNSTSRSQGQGLDVLVIIGIRMKWSGSSRCWRMARPTLCICYVSLEVVSCLWRCFQEIGGYVRRPAYKDRTGGQCVRRTAILSLKHISCCRLPECHPGQYLRPNVLELHA